MTNSITMQELVDTAEMLSRKKARLEQELADVKKEETELLEQAGPMLMLALGTISYEMLDGTKVKLRTPMYARLVVGKQKEAASWLVNKGQGGLIIGLVGVPLAYRTLPELERIAEDNHGELSMKIHPSSLSACIRNLEADGHAIPGDLFSIFRKSKVAITKPRSA